MDNIVKLLAGEFGKNETHIKNIIDLIDEGNTIPFIARYRKEAHGAMDDTSLRAICDRLSYLRGLEERRTEIIKLIDSQGKLTEELKKTVSGANTLAELEDIYRPYKQKRRTRASVAREKGLEPLCNELLLQSPNITDVQKLASDYIDDEKGVLTAKDALMGASDIIAETVSEDAALRKRLREHILKRGGLTSSRAKDEDSVYSMYYDFDRPISSLQDHHVLAINRGEKEGFLKAEIDVNKPVAEAIACGMYVKRNSAACAVVKNACEDGCRRLLFPSLEREMRTTLTDAACEGAIKNFALNLKPLLMQPPVKGHVTMGLDPGYKNGCKVAVVDSTGKVLDTAVVYPTFGERQKKEAIAILKKLVDTYKVEHIAIGNGTASRETEQMTCELIKLCKGVSYMIVNEAGASVYSVSELAAKEFPQFDVNLRSAVSIARRLQDPLAELVKIEPKAIGVGQYQHDMPEKRLNEALTGVVEDCVNAVGVDVNTASASLLKRVSGITEAIASNIVSYREENGAFTSRKQLLKVKGLGPKAYEQCAGFIRVPESKLVLDNTGVHPESYDAANKLLKLTGYSLSDVKESRLTELSARVDALGEENAALECEIGVPTLRDIIKELIKPGRDPRDELPAPILRTDVLSISDLKQGMILTGTVRNVIDFGAFVDIGVHQDGLVHISEICSHFLKHPSEVLSVGDVVNVKVLSVDERKKRISLSIKQAK
ncbi:MAG: RNA-binding transcriptional accessory protein [Christensenellaceae bacterium]|nr:RNA-binding transcriptional accessory protein [Christensenellaceae bacterium]